MESEKDDLKMEATDTSVVTVMEAAAMLRLDAVSSDPARTVRSLVARGQLQAVKIGKFLMVKRESINKLLEG